MRGLPLTRCTVALLGVSLALAGGVSVARGSEGHHASDGEALKRYEEVRDALVEVVDRQDPRIALRRVRELVESDPVIARFCHSLVHELAHRAYAKYRDFGEAARYQEEICNSGYLHGLVEAHFSARGDVATTAKTVCARYPATVHVHWQCSHGVGHGLMYYTANDLPRSVEVCDTLPHPRARVACASGAYMENFDGDPHRHPSRFLRESDPFYPCREQPPLHKPACYGYAPAYFFRLHGGDQAKALEWCLTAEAPFAADCARGVGAQALRRNVSRPRVVEQACVSGPVVLFAPCIEGMVNLHVAYYAALEPTRRLCRELDEARSRRACARWLERYARSGFPERPGE